MNTIKLMMIHVEHVCCLFDLLCLVGCWGILTGRADLIEILVLLFHDELEFLFLLEMMETVTVCKRFDLTVGVFWPISRE